MRTYLCLGIAILMAGCAAKGPQGTPLTPTTIEGVTVYANQYDALVPGDKSSEFDVWAEGAKVQAVTAWIGDKDAIGSVKARGASQIDGFKVYIEVPDPIRTPKLWVEMVTSEGNHLQTWLELNQQPA